MNSDGKEVDGVWQPPAVITPEMRLAAADELERQNTLCAPANPDSLRRWLIALGNLTASKDGEQSAADAIKLYTGTLEERRYPAGVFTKASLNRAAASWEWFPKYAPLVKFLDAEAERVTERRSRLAAIAGGQSARRRQHDDLPDEVPLEQRRKVADFFAQLTKGIAAAREGDDTVLGKMAAQYGGEIRTVKPDDAMTEGE